MAASTPTGQCPTATSEMHLYRAVCTACGRYCLVRGWCRRLFLQWQPRDIPPAVQRAILPNSAGMTTTASHLGTHTHIRTHTHARTRTYTHAHESGVACRASPGGPLFTAPFPRIRLPGPPPAWEAPAQTAQRHAPGSQVIFACTTTTASGVATSAVDTSPTCTHQLPVLSPAPGVQVSDRRHGSCVPGPTRSTLNTTKPTLRRAPTNTGKGLHSLYGRRQRLAACFRPRYRRLATYRRDKPGPDVTVPKLPVQTPATGLQRSVAQDDGHVRRTCRTVPQHS